MARVVWGAVGERYYETGVDHGVLYVENTGVAWNGLVTVTESPSGGEPKPYYIDGIKYLNVSAAEEFTASVEAFTYPDLFGECDGTTPIKNGLFATHQRRKSFGLSYRTRVGNDIEGAEHAYKIHIVYNALAQPSERTNNTQADEVEPGLFNWQLSTRAPILKGLLPTAHFVIDSRKSEPELIKQVTDILYGTDSDGPRLLTPLELIDLFVNYTSSDFVGVYDGGSPASTSTLVLNGGSPTSTTSDVVDGGRP